MYITKILTNTSQTLLAQATTGGGSELEKRYGLDLWRSKVTSSLGPAVYPPGK